MLDDTRTLSYDTEERSSSVVHAVEVSSTSIDVHSTHHNVPVSIYRLPPEIIEIIFSLLTTTDPPRRYEWQGHRLGWINVSHVCRRWRLIALNHSALWARIQRTLGDRWMEAMFSRARTSPLFIEFDPAPEHIEPLTRRGADLIAQNIQNTKTLQIYENIRVPHKVTRALKGPMPLLEELSIAYSPKLVDWGRSLTLLPEGAPLLRVLELTGHFCIPWEPTLFRNISSLNISLPAGSPAEPSHVEMLRFLDAAHALTSLKLVGNAVPRMSGWPHTAAIAHDERVGLYSLTDLHLEGAFWRCFPFLRYLELAPRTRVNMKLRFSRGVTPDVRPFFDALLSAFPVGVSFTRLLIESPVYFGLTIQAWRSDALDGNRAGDVRLELSWEWSGLAQIARDVTPKAFAALSAHLRDVTVTDHRWTSETWQRTPAPELQNLVARGPTAPELCLALFTGGPAFLPSLSDLTLGDAEFGRQFDVVVDQQPLSLPAYELLYRALVQRAKDGHPLSALTLLVYSSSVRAGWIEKLRETFPGTLVRVGDPCR